MIRILDVSLNNDSSYWILGGTDFFIIQLIISHYSVGPNKVKNIYKICSMSRRNQATDRDWLF